MAEPELGRIIIRDKALKGFVQMPIVLVLDPEVSGSAKVVYGLLLWYEWRGMGFPGQNAMAEHLGRSVRSVRNDLKELIDAGYLTVQQHGLGRPNTYIIESLQDRPEPIFPDRQDLAGLGGKILPVKAAESCRSLERQDFTTKNQQQQQAPPVNETPETPTPTPPTTVVVASHSTPPTTNDLTQRLTALGVAKTTARKLLKENDSAVVYRWLCYTEQKLKTGWMPKESPAAWLVSAIRSDDWVIPDWFQTPEEKEAARAQSERVVAEERKRREDAEAQERKEAEAQRRTIEKALGIGERERETWRQLLDLLQERRQMSPALFSAYLLPVKDSTAIIATPVKFFCEVLTKHSEAMRAALEEITGSSVEHIEVQHVEPS